MDTIERCRPGDSGNTGTMSLSLSATSGSFVNTIPTSQLVDTSGTFNHDDDDNTDELAVFSFSIGENDIYFIEVKSVVTVVKFQKI